MKNLGQFINENDLKKVEGNAPKPDPKSKNRIKWALNEPTNDDASDDIDIHSKENTKSVKQLIDKFRTEEPFFIQGEAGWGKTSIVRKLAKKFNREVITVYLDKAEATDLGGIPVPVEGNKSKAKVKNAVGELEEREFAAQIKAMPSWAKIMYDNPDTDFLLFFDEMNQAMPDVMNALMPIVLENEICEIKFDNFFVGAAGNYEHENRGAISELSGPLKSRFKPIIEWTSGEEAWPQAFKHLHSKWDKYLSKEFINVFEKNGAEIFENPRELDHKVFQYIYRIKTTNDDGYEDDNDAEKYLWRLEDLAKENLSRTAKAKLNELADAMFAFVAGTDYNAKTSKPKRESNKDINMIPEQVRVTVEQAMKTGFQSIKVGDKEYKFGISKENIGEIVNEKECNAEMLQKLIKNLELGGKKFKYEKSPDWKKLGLEDPLDDKWSFKIGSDTKLGSNSEPKKKKTMNDYANS